MHSNQNKTDLYGLPVTDDPPASRASFRVWAVVVPRDRERVCVHAHVRVCVVFAPLRVFRDHWMDVAIITSHRTPFAIEWVNSRHRKRDVERCCRPLSVRACVRARVRACVLACERASCRAASTLACPTSPELGGGGKSKRYNEMRS